MAVRLFDSVRTTIKLTEMLKAILTDIQFWIPLGALAVGMALLAWLH
jgi:hypothetical protein